jgi:hypothetical protein
VEYRGEYRSLIPFAWRPGWQAKHGSAPWIDAISTGVCSMAKSGRFLTIEGARSGTIKGGSEDVPQGEDGAPRGARRFEAETI